MRMTLAAMLLTVAVAAEPVVRSVGPHQAYWDEGKSNGLILVSLGGADGEAFEQQALELGYKVLSLDSPNKELVEDRLQSALAQLQWPQDWGKIVVVGHSQGSGQAAYLGQRHPLRGLLTLAAPEEDPAVCRQLLGPFRVACLSRKDTGQGSWVEHLQDSDPHLGQRSFLPSQQQKTPVVVDCFTTATPASSSLLLHYAGAPALPEEKPPVVIVPGAKVDATFYQTLAQTLKNQGSQVYTLTFAHNQDDNFVQAQQLANAIARVRQLTGASQVDLVAHSKGCIVATVYATPDFRQEWMTPYQGDVRRLLLVGGPNGGIDYFYRHPFEDQGASNWPMVWKTMDGKDCAAYQMGLAGYWPGQTQLLARWDRRYPPQDKLSYYGGSGPRFEADGIETALEAGENFMARLNETPLAPAVQVGLLAGNVADVPGFRNEKDGASDGIILLDSALQAPCGAKPLKKTVLPCNHIQLILGGEAQAQIAEFLR